MKDEAYVSNYRWGFFNGNTASSTRAISGSNLEVFNTQRWGGTNKYYHIEVPNGLYQVKLMFAETYWTGPGQRVFNVAVHPDRQSFKTLNQQEGIEGRKAGAHVSKRFHARFHEKSIMAERLVEFEVVIRGRWIRDRRIAAVIEIAGFQKSPGDGIAVPADEFGG